MAKAGGWRGRCRFGSVIWRREERGGGWGWGTIDLRYSLFGPLDIIVVIGNFRSSLRGVLLALRDVEYG